MRISRPPLFNKNPVDFIGILLLVTACGSSYESPRPAANQIPENLEPFSAQVTVRDQVLNTVNPLLFGDNIEWTNDGMGIWLREEKKFDEALVEEIHAAGVTHLRYPGGTLSDYFHWHHAIGPNRQPIPNPFAEPKGRPDYPYFGPDEFMSLCRSLGIPGTITLNAGTGSADEAASWIKYNQDRQYPVTDYTVGNEVYMAKAMGEPVPELPIDKNPQQYVDLYEEFQSAIGEAAAGVTLGMIGFHDPNQFSFSLYKEWKEVVLGRLGGQAPFIDVHCGYYPILRGSLDPNAPLSSDDDFARCMMASSIFAESILAAIKEEIKTYAPNGGETVRIHLTEYGPLVYPVRQDRAVEDAAWNRSLAGALYLASLYHVFLKDPKITSANHLPLCQDIFGALIGIRGEYPNRRHWRNIVFHVFQMYSRMQNRQVLAVAAEAPGFAIPAIGVVPEMKDVPSLDAAACRTVDGRALTLFLVNRDVYRTANVTIDPGARTYAIQSLTTLTADSYKAENTPEQPDAVVPQRREGRPVLDGTGRFQVSLAKHSLTEIELTRE
ncbi:MAG: alpha-L-arabinofuranosidase C-terminal domain-containing protein [bacterium]